MRAAVTLIGVLIAASAGAEQPAGFDPFLSAASYTLPLTRHSAMFGHLSSSGNPALELPTSYVWRFSYLDDPHAQIASRWLESSRPISQIFTLGYVWRNLKLEGSASSSRDPDQSYAVGKGKTPKLESTSSRLSSNPTPNWVVQISRGNVGNLDQMQPNEEIRRTMISAGYRRAFNDADWQTTFAWGRNARRYQESTMGYLLESTLKLNEMHAFFGRLEQVGSDDLIRDNETLAKQMFKMNKLTVGYFHGAQSSGPVKFDIGGLLSRHFVPSTMAPAYGSKPTSYMIFVRLKLR